VIRLNFSSWLQGKHECSISWGGAGHQLIAAEAYRQLSPELKAGVIEVLKAQYAMD
jgi:hypothetical protein